jgi:hypothetical protein
VLGVVHVGAVVVEGRERPDQAGHHGHGVGVAPEPAQEELHLVVDHRVLEHALVEVVALALVGQLAVEQQVTGVEVVAMLGQLLDGVAAVEQLALVAIDVGDGGLAGRGGHEARVVGEHAGLRVKLADVQHVRPNGALVDRQIEARRAIGKR